MEMTGTMQEDHVQILGNAVDLGFSRMNKHSGIDACDSIVIIFLPLLVVEWAFSYTNTQATFATKGGIIARRVGCVDCPPFSDHTDKVHVPGISGGYIRFVFFLAFLFYLLEITKVCIVEIIRIGKNDDDKDVSEAVGKRTLSIRPCVP